MLRISRAGLAEHWALTYAEDGYNVRARDVTGLPSGTPANADLEARKGSHRVLVHIIESAEELSAPHTRRELQTLCRLRGPQTTLHVVVAAECLGGLKQQLDDWDVHPDQVHVT